MIYSPSPQAAGASRITYNNMKIIQTLLLTTAIFTLASCATKKADSSCSSCSSCGTDKKAATTGTLKKAAAATPQGQAASAGMKAAEKAKAQ
jgi:hypothetical protein